MSYLEGYRQTGAATNRRRAKRDPLALMYELCAENSTAGKEEIFKKWKKKCLSDDAWIDAVLDYAAANMWSSRLKEESKNRRTVEYLRKDRERQTLLAEEIADSLTYLDMIAPNGKQLRHCTFAEAAKFTGMFKLLASKGKPNEIIGEKLSEADLQKIFK